MDCKNLDELIERNWQKMNLARRQFEDGKIPASECLRLIFESWDDNKKAIEEHENSIDSMLSNFDYEIKPKVNTWKH